jgi:hypothetical protein
MNASQAFNFVYISCELIQQLSLFLHVARKMEIASAFGD